ncbi:peptidase S8/S53 domain-containing protein [Butyriboletus roseoflavus]|nr:peptidase S8/S53 domain-containing protein [Butyriboletus roseoflavus]
MSQFTLAFLAASLASSALATPLSTSSYTSHRRPYLGVAPLVEVEHVHGTINNSYIVVLKDDIPPSLMQNHLNFLQSAHLSDSFLGDNVAFGLRHVYDTHIKGYAGEFTDGVLEQIRAMPEVDFIERDQIVRTTDIDPIDTQKGAPWGLARISHRDRLTFGTFTSYVYNSNGGEGVDVYIVDTGININHAEFEDRASWGKTIPTNDEDEDGNGHGSHCAGTIGSRKYGVAKKANLIAVKVLGSNGSGSMSDVVAGVAWASQQAQRKAAAARAEIAATGKTAHKGSVGNMSLGGSKSPSLDRVVDRSVEAGLHFAVAAGNDDKDACDYSPAASKNAITVGASTLGDERAYFSNWGTCVDVFAPGLNILSTYTGSPTAIATLSGTSMASPHVAGLIAYLLSIYPSVTFNPSIPLQVSPEVLMAEERYTSFYAIARAVLPHWMSQYLPSPDFFVPVPGPLTMTPNQLRQAIVSLSTHGVITDVGKGSPNLLVFNNATA